MSVPETEIGAPEAAQPPGVPAGVATRVPTAALSRREIALHLAALVLLLLAPLFLGPADLTTLGRILYYALLAASLALLVGIVGLPSLGHAAYFGIGAYTAGLVARDVTTSFWVLLIAATVVAGVAAAATGWLAVRSRGIFFLMLTLAIGEIVFLFAERAEGLTGGSNGLFGIPTPEIAPGTDLSEPATMYWLIVVVFAIGYVLLSLVSRSPFGLALRGVRDNEDRMRALGYSTPRYKFVAFIVAGAIAGLAGALLASQQRLVTPADASFGTAVVALVAVIIGGAGSLWGACLGAGIVIIVRDEIGASLDGHGPLLLGAVFIIAVYVLPGGVAGLIDRLERRRQ
jgi:branched-chain amino acid transport system permease protein